MSVTSDLIGEVLALVPTVQGKKAKSKLRRTKRRLIKSLDKEISALLDSLSRDEIEKLLVNRISKKFGLEINGIQNETNNSKGEMENSGMDVDQIYRNLSSVERKMFESIADAFAKELNQLTLNKVCSERTAVMCSSSMCNGLPGTMVEEVFGADIDIVDGKITLDYGRNYQNRFRFFKATLKGKSVFAKQMFSNLHDGRLILSHELQILTLITYHPSIIHPIGFTEVDLKPTAIFEDVPSTSLADFRGFEVIHLKHVLKHLLSALEFIHSKKIILNFLTEQSVAKISWEEFSIPMITDFSWACHEKGSVPLSLFFQSKFAETKHLPNRVLKGKLPPSFNSDIFSFGMLMSRLIKRICQIHTSAEEKAEIEHLIVKLLSNQQNHFPTELRIFLNR